MCDPSCLAVPVADPTGLRAHLQRLQPQERGSTGSFASSGQAWERGDAAEAHGEPPKGDRNPPKVIPGFQGLEGGG